MLGMSMWLKTVISVIMLATFVDLLLPSSTMQRYVRTVMSLFVLLTLLSPLVQLFQRSWEPERLFSLIEGEQARMAAAEQLGQLPSLEAVQQKAEQLKAASAQQEKKLVEAQLASQIKSRLQSETTLQIASVSVSTDTDKHDKPYIKDVQISLSPALAGRTAAPKVTATASSSTSGTAGSPPSGLAGGRTHSSNPGGEPLAIEINPITPVQIRVGDVSDHYTSAEAVPAASGAAPPEYRQAQAAITRVLGLEYQLTADRIRTSYLGSAHAS